MTKTFRARLADCQAEYQDKILKYIYIYIYIEREREKVTYPEFI